MKRTHYGGCHAHACRGHVEYTENSGMTTLVVAIAPNFLIFHNRNDLFFQRRADVVGIDVAD